MCILTSSTVPVHLGGRAYSNAHFGAGSGPIFLDDVQCTSSASQLLECPSRPILSHNCRHSADAGVGCEGVLYHCRASFRSLLREGGKNCALKSLGGNNPSWRACTTTYKFQEGRQNLTKRG